MYPEKSQNTYLWSQNAPKLRSQNVDGSTQIFSYYETLLVEFVEIEYRLSIIFVS